MLEATIRMWKSNNSVRDRVQEEDQIQCLDDFWQQFVVLIRLREHPMEEVHRVRVGRFWVNNRQPKGVAIEKGGDRADLGN